MGRGESACCRAIIPSRWALSCSTPKTIFLPLHNQISWGIDRFSRFIEDQRPRSGRSDGIAREVGRLSFVQESRRRDRHAFPYHDTAQAIPANQSIEAAVHLMALSRRKKFCFAVHAPAEWRMEKWCIYGGMGNASVRPEVARSVGLLGPQVEQSLV